MLKIKEINDISKIALTAAHGYILSRQGRLKQAIDKFEIAMNIALYQHADCLKPKPRSLTQNVFRQLLCFALKQGGFAAYRSKYYVYALDLLELVAEEWESPSKKTLLHLGLLWEKEAHWKNSCYYYFRLLKIAPFEKGAIEGFLRCEKELAHIVGQEELVKKIYRESKTNCSYFAFRSPIKCAVNPAGSCDGCIDYDPIRENDCPF
jgi:tetratricopeptide (TPR) repeat protein